jgi:hypothetical protein
MSELRTRMIRDMTLRGLSPSTHEAYIGQVVQLAKYYSGRRISSPMRKCRPTSLA